jgi:hypothetical protein
MPEQWSVSDRGELEGRQQEELVGDEIGLEI